jgi:hypothetical protein
VPARTVGWMSAYGGVLDSGAGDPVTDSQGHRYEKISDNEVRRELGEGQNRIYLYTGT